MVLGVALATLAGCNPDRPLVEIRAELDASCPGRGCASFLARCVRRIGYTLYRVREEPCTTDAQCPLTGLRCRQGRCVEPEQRRCREVSLTEPGDTVCAVRHPVVFDTGELREEIRRGPFIVEVAGYGDGMTLQRPECEPGSRPLLFRGQSDIIDDIEVVPEIYVPLGCHLTCGDRYAELAEDTPPLEILLVDVRTGRPMAFDEENPPPGTGDIRFGDLFEGDDLADFNLMAPDLSLLEDEALVIYRRGFWYLPGGPAPQCRAFVVTLGNWDVMSCIGRPSPNGVRYRARVLDARTVDGLATFFAGQLNRGMVVGRIVPLEDEPGMPRSVEGLRVTHDNGFSPAYNLAIDGKTGRWELVREVEGNATGPDGLFYFRGVPLGQIGVDAPGRCFTRPVVASLTNTVFVTEIRELAPDEDTGTCPAQ